MSKQTEILKNILSCFENLHVDVLQNKQAKLLNSDLIRIYFKKSLNKNAIIRKILNDCVLSNDEIIELLRIIYKKNEGKKNAKR